jgi:predicted metalloprotease with PDZ domain
MTLTRKSVVALALLVSPALLPGGAVPAVAAVGTITLSVDATEAPRKIFHARMTIPAKPGPLTLLYPKWIPGEHGPSGPIADLAGLTITASGKPVPWRRDLTDMFTFRCDVPAGASAVEVALDYLSPATAEGFSAGASATAQMTVVSWNQILLYPAGPRADDLLFEASLRLPPGWQLGTALPVAAAERETPGTIRFKPVSLMALVDSPVIAGAMFRVVPLNPGSSPSHEIDIAADSAAALEMSPERAAAYSRLVDEAQALFGATHYRDYHFLLTLSDHTAHFGLEHHESSDDRIHERSLIDPDLWRRHASLLPHEFVHSWNGKYRRPADLATPDYQKPMESDLLWVYEGLTDYLGYVLTARSGLETADQVREEIAAIGAEMDHRPGRDWRPLVDTAVAAQILYGVRPDWRSWRRGVDFYHEGVLIWLEADVLIRRQTNGGRSLDDFCRRFHGAPGGAPKVATYTADDVYAALNAVAPYDWRKFFADRVYAAPTKAPLGGITGSGWRLAYARERTSYLASIEEAEKTVDCSSSIGLTVKKHSGEILDAIQGMAAAAAGIAPGMRLVAINGRRFSPDVLRDALRATKSAAARLDLLIENAEYYETHAVDYHEGDRYPFLERDPAGADLLSEILKPHAAARASAASAKP